jgi:hypothetical protein
MEDSLDSERDEDDNTADNSNNPGGGILQTLSLFSPRHLSQSSVSNSFLDQDEPHIREKKKENGINHRRSKPRRVVEMESYTLYSNIVVYSIVKACEV